MKPLAVSVSVFHGREDQDASASTYDAVMIDTVSLPAFPYRALAVILKSDGRLTFVDLDSVTVTPAQVKAVARDVRSDLLPLRDR